LSELLLIDQENLHCIAHLMSISSDFLSHLLQRWKGN